MDADPHVRLSLRSRLEMLAFGAELAGFPRSLIDAVWEAVDRVGGDTPPGGCNAALGRLVSGRCRRT